MASLRGLTLSCLLAGSQAVSVGSRHSTLQLEEPRPNYTEWKATKAKEAEAAANATEKQSKMGAIDKTITMLADLQKQLLDEGEKESWTYNKFSCFCKDTIAEKNEAITEGKTTKQTLEANIGALESERDGLDTTMANLQTDMENIDKAVKEAKDTREGELKTYRTNADDLSAALEALAGAIKSLKAAKAPSLLQMQEVAKTVREYATMADVMGIGGKSAERALALLQQPEVPTENYKFKSDDVISTLEGLEKQFRTEKESVDAAEVAAVASHDLFLQEKHDERKQKEREFETAKKQHEQKMAIIAETSQQLTTVAATLLDDQQYLEELAGNCNRKAVTWDHRTQVRTEELTALTSALNILKGFVADKSLKGPIRFLQHGVSMPIAEALAKSEDGMESIEAATEADEGIPLSFVQKFLAQRKPPAASEDDAREAVLDMLRGKGKNLHSAVLMNLVSQLADDKFAKVKILIEELIERLQKEAMAEADHKAWCDKSQSDAEEKRNNAAEQVRELNSNMARLEALRDKLAHELDVLAKEIKELKSAQDEATKIREAESAENTVNINDAKEGAEAVRQATDVLEKYYLTQAKATVSLAQQPDAPDAGFDNEETYKGADGAAMGIIGMLKVIISDFERTVKETELAEENARQDHLAFMTETGKSVAEKETAESEKTTQKGAAVEDLGKDQESLDTQTGLVITAIKELVELKSVCNVKMTYAERVARRQDEIDALHRALCIFNAYEQYGPDGVATNC